MEKETLDTFDLGLAAFLVTKGFEMLKIDRSDARKSKFYFRPDGRRGNIFAIADSYWNDQGEVGAQGFFNNLKMLKNRLYSN